MSCITMVGRNAQWNPACDVPLRHSMPEWTVSKMQRLTRLALSEDPRERAVAAAHPKTERDRLLVLLLDENTAVRRAAVKNPNMTETFYLLAARDSDVGIAAYAKMVLEDEEA